MLWQNLLTILIKKKSSKNSSIAEEKKFKSGLIEQCW